jgi:hypothetical protein
MAFLNSLASVSLGLFVLASLFAAWVLLLGGDQSDTGAAVANAWYWLFNGLLCALGGDWRVEPLGNLDPDQVRLVVLVMWFCTAGLAGMLYLFAAILQC